MKLRPWNGGLWESSDHRIGIISSKIGQGIWKVFVATDGDGVFLGALAGHRHPASSLTGPGIATNEETMSALIWQALDMQRGKTTVFLVPAMARKLVAFAYRLGARNCELHISQCVSADSDRMPLWQNPKGVAMPTFFTGVFLTVFQLAAIQRYEYRERFTTAHRKSCGGRAAPS